MATAVVTENALAVREEQRGELAPSSEEAKAQHEIQSAIVIARRFPRDEMNSYQMLLRSCQRPSFAERAAYHFPRGKKQDEHGNWVENVISGPSVYLAREFARTWGNIRHGFSVVVDTEDSRTVRGFAWDLQTNSQIQQESTFKKLVQRTQGTGKSRKTIWVVPDERDLRELTNKFGALCQRNCLMQILPRDMVEDAMLEAEATLHAEAAKDPDATAKKIVRSFMELNVSAENLTAYLGHSLSQCSPPELTKLRQLYQTIKEGQTTWAEAAAAKVEGGSKTEQVMEQLKTKNGEGKPAERQPGEEG
jgi:hypothetical protein